MMVFTCLTKYVSDLSKNLKLVNVPARNYLLLLTTLFIGAIISARWFDTSLFLAKKPSWKPSPFPPFNCSAGNQTIICSHDFPVINYPKKSDSDCPEYFRWIHEDLRPWKKTGITKEMVERAKKSAHFRLVVVEGRVYVEKLQWVYQTRDVFTIWGILQLLRRYPGKVPDFEMMFNCGDVPVVRPSTEPAAVFHYCGDDSTVDIVFPDWSFWGWPEINIKPWDSLMKELKEGNDKIKWIDRKPSAYWKGNPHMSQGRRDLMRCDGQDWNAHIYTQNWFSESQQGFKQSNLKDQCTHRYKIYIEGAGWSVSEKYILACDSLTLFVKNRYSEFFTRALMPLQHYWPIKNDDMCKSIKFAVDWGNSHEQQAQEIGKAASTFIQEELKMDHVYDYMFHLLTEYSKLLRYKPSKPAEAIELCPEVMACPSQGLENKFKRESMVNSPSNVGPCNLPPPFDPQSFKQFLEKKANATKQVEIWEQAA